MGVDPYQLKEDVFSPLLNEAIWLTEFDRKLLVNAIDEPLQKVMGELFGKK